ncbi:MAG: hypothetical protein N3G20_05515, partial [Verrucomicrobiae bacterium]|nr:hypothetical protein [Verrucomicrobiae bacterium]
MNSAEVHRASDAVNVDRSDNDVRGQFQKSTDVPGYHQDLGWYPDRLGNRKPVRCISHWERRRKDILRCMTEVMGPLPGQEKRCRLDYAVVSETDCGDFVRQDILYTAEPEDRVPAYLLVPKIAIQGRTRCSA